MGRDYYGRSDMNERVSTEATHSDWEQYNYAPKYHLKQGHDEDENEEEEEDHHKSHFSFQRYASQWEI